MKVETIKILFTVTCGTHSCPSNTRLNRLRPLGATSSDSGTRAALAIARKAVEDDLKKKDPRLVEIGHYRMELPNGEKGRDVFIGIANIEGRVLDPNEEGKLAIAPSGGREYLNDMFVSFFQDLNEPGDKDFTWLTWVIVPLDAACAGSFNPIGMGGTGGG